MINLFGTVLFLGGALMLVYYFIKALHPHSTYNDLKEALRGGFVMVLGLGFIIGHTIWTNI
jgi:hypothetical protein